MDFGGQRRAAAISRAWHARHARYTLEYVTVMPRAAWGARADLLRAPPLDIFYMEKAGFA
jgi:hypothetical protein